MKTSSIGLIWVIVNIIISFIFFVTAIIPGINFIGIPIVLATSGLVNTIFIVWILIRLIQRNQKKAGFTNYTQNHKVKKD